MCCAHSPVRADRIQQSTKRLPCPSNFSELRIFEKWVVRAPAPCLRPENGEGNGDFEMHFENLCSPWHGTSNPAAQFPVCINYA